MTENSPLTAELADEPGSDYDYAIAHALVTAASGNGDAISDAIDDAEHQDDEPVEAQDDGCRCNSYSGNCPEHGPR